MAKKAYVGIDLAKGSSVVAVVDENGEDITRPFSIKNSVAGTGKILSKLSGYKKENILCGMEASSNYWENMLSYFKQRDIPCLLINPFQVKKYREAIGKRIKTDKVDAEAIA